MLVLEGLLGLHRTVQLQLFQHYWSLCAPGPRDPTKTETELCLSVSYGGTGQQWTAIGAGALSAADLGMAGCSRLGYDISPLGGDHH